MYGVRIYLKFSFLNNYYLYIKIFAAIKKFIYGFVKINCQHPLSFQQAGNK